MENSGKDKTHDGMGFPIPSGKEVIIDNFYDPKHDRKRLMEKYLSEILPASSEDNEPDKTEELKAEINQQA